MTSESYPFKIIPTPPSNHWGRWFIALVLLILVLGLWLLFLLHQSAPNYYQPAREALVAARHRLHEYYSHESVIIQELYKAHNELEAAISLLNKAENLDPADRLQLDALRLRLRQLDNANRATPIRSDQLRDSYRGVAQGLDALIHKLETPITPPPRADPEPP